MKDIICKSFKEYQEKVLEARMTARAENAIFFIRVILLMTGITATAIVWK